MLDRYRKEVCKYVNTLAMLDDIKQVCKYVNTLAMLDRI